MKLNFENDGQFHSLELQGDDLADLVAQAVNHFEQSHPSIHAQEDFPARLVDAVLNGLARDLTEIDLQLQ